MKVNQKTWRWIDIIVLVAVPVVSVMLSLLLRAGLLLSTILFYAIPSAYFSMRTPKGVKRALIFAFLVGSIGVIIDYLMAADSAWIIPSTLFPFRILGTSTIDAILWSYFYVYAVVIFYEHFIDKAKHNLVAKKFRYLIYIVLGITIPFGVFYLVDQRLLREPFGYFKGSLVLVLAPAILFLKRYPNFFSRFAKVGIYFFILGLLHELTALELHQWVFPGTNFVGWVSIGQYRLPFEELFFYLILSAVSILCYFEYFDDSHLKKEARRYT